MGRGEIVDRSDHVAVHKFNADKNKWDEHAVEAALYVCRHTRHHFLKICHKDSDTEEVEVEDITAQRKVKIDSPFLFYKNEENEVIRSFRFTTEDECVRIGRLVQQLIIEHDVKPQPIGILSMLAKVQELIGQAVSGDPTCLVTQSMQNPKTISTKTDMTPSSSSSVRNLFAGANHSATRHTSSFERMLSEPMHIDHIEGEQRFSFPTHLPKPLITLKRARSKLKYTYSDNKPKLVLPTSFSVVDNVADRHITQNRSEPLTHNQLLQAMVYLIKTDEDFMSQLYEAYLQSFLETLQNRRNRLSE